MTKTFRRLASAALATLTASTVLTLLPAPAASAVTAEQPVDPAAGACPFKGWHSSQCVAVELKLDRLPTLGQRAVATYTVKTSGHLVGQPMEVVLSATPGLRLVETPKGAALGQGVSDLGPTAQATLSIAGAPAVVGTAVVEAIAPGASRLTIKASRPGSDAVTDSAAAEERMTIGGAGESTTDGRTEPGPQPAQPLTTAPAPPSSEPQREAPKPVKPTAPPVVIGQDESPDRDGDSARAPNDTCFDGGFYYVDQNGTTMGASNMTVNIWDHDDASANDLVGQAVTDANGRFYACYDSHDGEAGTNDVYAEFYTTNANWKVSDEHWIDSTVYSWTTNRYDNVAPGSYTFGNWQPSPGLNRPVHIHDAMTKFWDWTPTACWDATGECRQIDIQWDPDSDAGDNSRYTRSTDTVHITTVHADFESVVLHEAGHAVMDDVYEDQMPDVGPDCPDHSIDLAETHACAWVEGFANWVQAGARGKGDFLLPGGGFDLENQTWGTPGWHNTDAVEGRVAGAMIDLEDATNEGPWDRVTEGQAYLWQTFQGHRNETFASFWNSRLQDYPNPPVDDYATLYGSTIDYGFKDPLSINAAVSRPRPVNEHGQKHNYSFYDGAPAWSVTALRSAPGDDKNLGLFDDSAMTSQLTKTTGYGILDVIAVHSSLRPDGDYYPQITNWKGTQDYQLEVSEAPVTRSGVTPIIGTKDTWFATGDVVQAYDLPVTAGQTVALKMLAGPNINASMYVFSSEAGDSSTWVRQGAAAITQLNANANMTATFSFKAAASKTYGVAILNRGGSGKVRTWIDNTKPTGSVQIQYGLAHTKNRSVNVATTYSDAEIAVDAMRLTFDGALDTEPWVEASNSTWMTLPGADGIKKVLAQFRNPSGLVSGTYYDTIKFDETAPTGSIQLNGGAAETSTSPITANLTYSDPTSGVTKMRLSTDGTMDTEAWVEPAATASVPVSGNEGTRTVKAQFRNAVGLNSPVYSDDILYLSPANLITSHATPGVTEVKRGSLLATSVGTWNTGGKASVAGTSIVRLVPPSFRTTAPSVDLGTGDVGVLQPKGKYNFYKSFTVPGGMMLGSYSLSGCADSGKTTPETKETDNCKSSVDLVKVVSPDLGISSVAAGSTATPGGTLAVSSRTINATSNVGAKAVPTHTAYYLSEDQTKQFGDQLMGWSVIPELVNGGYYDGTAQAAVNSHTPKGTYYVIACADQKFKETYERSETNNCLASTTTVTIG